jgi:hypothetical protein
MEPHDEACVSEYLQLMTSYHKGLIDARSYQSAYFSLMVKRIILTEEESRILQQAYGDADDYDAELKLEYTIDEPELRARVSRSIAELIALENQPKL